MWTDEDRTRLKLALEPEAAALHIRDYFTQMMESGSNVPEMGHERKFDGLQKGDRFLFCFSQFF